MVLVVALRQLCKNEWLLQTCYIKFEFSLVLIMYLSLMYSFDIVMRNLKFLIENCSIEIQ